MNVGGPRGDRRALAALALILLIGALVRVAYLTEVRERPDFGTPTVDALFNDYWARGLTTGQWTPPAPHQDPLIGTSPYFRPPGYPYFLASVYRLFGDSPLTPRLAQMLLGLASGLLVFLIGRRWCGVMTGLLAATVTVTFWSLVYFEGELLETPLLTLLFVGLVGAAGLWGERATYPRDLLAGSLLGLATIVRPNSLLLLPTLLFWGWPAVAGAFGRAAALRHATITAAACAAVVAVVAARNYVASGELVLVSTNGGINIFIGNNDAATGECAGGIAGLGRYDTCFDYGPLVNALAAKVGRPVTPSEASAIFTREAATWVREHPVAELRLLVRKTLLFWGPLQVSHNREDEIDRETSDTLRSLPLGFPFVLALAALGTGLALRPGHAPAAGSSGRRMALLLALFALAYFASFLPFFIAGRYRVPVVPLLALLGAGGAERLWRRWRAGDRKQVAAALAVFAALWAAASVNWAGYHPDRARWHYDNGLAHIRTGEVHRAVAEFQQAVDVAPGNFQARSDLGSAYAVLGETGRARQEWERALALDPGYPLAHFNLGRLEASSGRTAAAIAHMERAVTGNPSSWLYRYELAELLLASGRTTDAAAELRAADTLDPGNPTVAALLSRIAHPRAAGESE